MSRMPNLHPVQGGSVAGYAGMRKIRKIFGKNQSSSKYSSEEDGLDESGSPVMSGAGMTAPSGCNSSTSSGRNLHGHPGSHKGLSQVPVVLTTQETPSPAEPAVDLEPLLSELKERREETSRLQEEVDSLKSQLQSECTLFHQSLQEERFRFERVEEQMNDLIELHQNEIENLKQGIADMEEKIQYQSEERLRDVYEMLDSCQTRISRMEHQQHQHLQQLVNLDSLENSNARALVLKLINVLLTILQVILLLVATVAGIITPFLHTRIRILTTLIFLLILTVIFRNRREVGGYLRTHFGDQFPLIEVLLSTQDE